MFILYAIMLGLVAVGYGFIGLIRSGPVGYGMFGSVILIKFGKR